MRLRTDFNKIYIKNKKVYLVFDIDTFDFGDKSVNNEDIKRELNSKIQKEEKTYVKLFTVSKKQATYEFNLCKWFEKSITDKIINTPDRFKKKIKINKMPSFITKYINLGMLSSLVDGTFRNYLEANKKKKKEILNSVKADNLSKLKFEYDNFYSVMIFSLKTEFQTKALLNLEECKKINIDFDKMVKEILRARRKKS